MAASERRTRAVLGAGWSALVGLHLVLSASLSGPSVVFDEAGYLGNARWLAGAAGGATWDMPLSPSYASGYSLLLAPVVAVVDDPDVQWRAVLVVNALLLATVLPLLFAVLTRVLGVARRPALAGALVGALAPAVLAAGISAIAENLVLPLVLVLVLAAHALVAPPAGRWAWTRLGLGPVVALLVTTHPRFTLTVPVTLVALGLAWRLRLAPGRVVAVNAGLLAGLGGVGAALNRAVVDGRWTRVERLEGGPGDWVRLATSADGLRELALEAVGQAWYLAAGSIGLAVVGLLVALRLVRGRALDGGGVVIDGDGDGSTSMSMSTSTGDRPLSPVAGRFALAVLLATAASVFATSVVFFAQNQFRADHWVYGRHNDSFTPLLVGLGVASLLSPSSWRRRLVDLALAGVAIVVTGIVVAAARDPRELGNDLSAFAVPAIVRWARTDPAGVFGRATLVGLAGLSALVVALVAVPLALSPRAPADVGADSAQNLRQRRSAGLRRAGATGVVVALAAWSVWVGSAAAQVTDDFQSISADGWHLPEQVVDVGIESLAIEERAAKSLPTLTYPFALPGVSVTTYSAARGEDPGGPYAVARLDDADRIAAGDRAVLIDEGGWYGFFGAPLGLAVWVRPGPEQDLLEADGALLPADFPGSLPTSARSVEFGEFQDRLDQRVLRLPPGGSADVVIEGRHTGTGAPWPDRDSFGQDGRVVVEVRSKYDLVGPHAPAQAYGELDRWVRPGDRFLTTVTVRAVRGDGTPLRPGAYPLKAGVTQAGESWFADSDQFSLVLSVR